MSGYKTLHSRFAKVALLRGLSFINNHPKLQRYALVIIRILGLYSLARAIYARMAPVSCRLDMRNPYGYIPTDVAHLHPRARQIYVDLKVAIAQRQKENG